MDASDEIGESSPVSPLAPDSNGLKEPGDYTQATLATQKVNVGGSSIDNRTSSIP